MAVSVEGGEERSRGGSAGAKQKPSSLSWSSGWRWQIWQKRSDVFPNFGRSHPVCIVGTKNSPVRGRAECGVAW
jgi:hypothetical protein